VKTLKNDNRCGKRRKHPSSPRKSSDKINNELRKLGFKYHC
jgi:hypothetical protein